MSYHLSGCVVDAFDFCLISSFRTPLCDGLLLKVLGALHHA